MAQPTVHSPKPNDYKQRLPCLTMPPISSSPEPQENEFQVDSAIESVVYFPCLDVQQDQRDRLVSENPFDSESSRALLEAMDFLQSCGVDQKLAIPQLIVLGGQSTGKSSLLQSLTDIPFPVGAGCCTGFATRILSRRTAPGSINTVKITIRGPEVTDVFNYPHDDSYMDYVHVSDLLGFEELKNVIEEVSSKFMRMRRDEEVQAKNFATQVLHIELSGPNRSQFSILDMPGDLSYAQDVIKRDLDGLRMIVEECLEQPVDIVICVAAATADLSTQGVFQMADSIVNKKRLVGVFTKCDTLENPTEVINIASGQGEDLIKSVHDGWFVVRNRSEVDGDDLGFKEAEREFFNQLPWGRIREDRRGSTMLQRYLGDLLCAQIRANFPTIQESVQRLLSEAEASRKSLGDPRSTHNIRRQYIRDVIDRYHTIAAKTLKSPGSLSDIKLRVRGLVREANEGFTADMQDRGHTYMFEDLNIDPMTQLEETVAYYSARLAGRVPIRSQGNEYIRQEQMITPPLTPTKKQHIAQKGETTSPQLRAVPFVEEIRDQLRTWQTTELPGLVNTEIIQVLYKKQSEHWQSMAEQHIENIANDIEAASNGILESVCSPNSCSSILYEELSRVLAQLQQQAKSKAIQELKRHWLRERESQLQTTDSRFQKRLRALRTVRLLRAFGSMPGFPSGTFDMDHSKLLFQHFHHSIEINMVHEVHDVVKVYYELSLEAFIRYVTNNIVEDLVSHSESPLRGLSTDWVFKLSEAEVEKMAREDEKTLRKRDELDEVVEKLTTAHRIVEKAMAQTQRLSDI